MALIETESLVLKSYNLAEADKIVVLLTQNQGVVRGVAKGAKRLNSKFGSGLEPFSVIRSTYVQKDAVELVSIENIDLVHSNFLAASDPNFLSKFAYLSDLLVSLLPPHDPSEVLYRMVRSCLRTAMSDTSSLSSIGVYFEIWLLRLSGYLPDWTRCGQCADLLAPNGNLDLGTDFRITCSDCRKSRAPQTITARERELAAMAMRVAPDEFCRMSAESVSELERLSAIFQTMISLAAGRDVKS